MRKRVLPRIVWFLFLYCAVFILLVAVQFTRKGNFSKKTGDMLVSGRYSVLEGAAERGLLDDGAAVFFGGLEFRLSRPPETDLGLTLFDTEGGGRPVSAEYVAFSDNEAVFTLPGGTEISFASGDSGGAQGNGPELLISGKFADGVSAVYIPFRPQRSSVVLDSGGGALSISYNKNRYQFSRVSQELESGRLALVPAAPAVSYRAVPGKKEFDPAAFTIAEAETPRAFSNALSLWTARNFRLWEKMADNTGEDTVVAWCAEAVRQGAYGTAASVVPAAFSSSPQRSWESAVYQFDRRTGIWEREVKASLARERERLGAVSRRLSEKDADVFSEDRLIEFLAVLGEEKLIDGLAEFAGGFDPAAVTLENAGGILECSLDMEKWHPSEGNPFEPLAEQACLLAAEGLRAAGGQVFVFSGGIADTVYNLRLGKAFSEWGEKNGADGWASIGRTLVLSVLSLCDEYGYAPASLAVNGSGGFAGSGGQVDSARLYRLLDNNEYAPRALATGTEGVWAWTAASSVSVTQNERQMDIAVSFPVGDTHYLMLRNVKPIPALQIYGTNWRRASDFESYYDSSGWNYFSQEQTLVLKIRHRSNVENIRILFVLPRVEPPPPAEAPAEEPPVSPSPQQ